MIRYALSCAAGHRFESWFADSAGFDALVARGLVACPRCETTDVAKAIMAPAVVGRGTDRSLLGRDAAAASDVARRDEGAEPVKGERAGGEAAEGVDAKAAGGGTVGVAPLDDPKRRMLRALREQVLTGTRDVGPDFAREARRIHAEDSGERIRGQATLGEARELLEDGLMVLPLPASADDLN